jgi:hypothetical protein
MFKAKIKETISVRRLLALVGLIILVGLSFSSPLGAEPSAFTQGYSTDGPVQTGMIVRLKEGDASKIEPLAPENVEKMHGVVVDANDAPVTLSAEGQKIFVATSGSFEVLVSSQNGFISTGDYIALSAIHGIGMKAGDKEAMVIGRALADFSEKSEVVSAATIKDSAGGQRNVTIGRVLVHVSVARNPLLTSSKPNLPEFLQKVSESIAGKPVQATRVYIALVVFGITTVISGSLLYGGIRSAITSLGRNPLSKKSIIRGMFQVIVAGLIIFIIGIFGVYLLLKL